MNFGPKNRAPRDTDDVTCPSDLKEATSWYARPPGVKCGTQERDCTTEQRAAGTCTERGLK